jgi:phosphoribosyl 1,2-cyclic phosphodiesterase
MDSILQSALGPDPRAARLGGSSEVQVRFWGTRGSIPAPGSATTLFGGNTSCVEIRLGTGRRIILDAGSGLRALGHALVSEGQPLDETVFLTHFHWDHIQGFPFFAPLYERNARVCVVAPEQRDGDAETLFAGQMGPTYFPVSVDALSARLSFQGLNEGSWESESFRVSAMRVRHASFTVAYRVEVGGRVITYAPDNELIGGAHEVPEDWALRFEAFVRGSDILIHDAMYTPREYELHDGWGHSTFDQALALAVRTEVPRVFFFHHSPERSDAELGAIVEEMRSRVRLEGHPLDLLAAAEGKEIVLPVKVNSGGQRP